MADTTQVKETAPLPDANLGIVGRFELLSRKGEGGQSDVFLARDVDLGRPVAIKFLLKPDAEAEMRMQREAHILASVRHQNICAIYDIGSDPVRGTYLVLELLEGENLREVLAAGNVGPDRAMSIVHDLAAALQVAHEKGVVHRDLKPENVAVLPDGSLKLFDFGIAKTGPSTITIGVQIGTPGYMSPEQHQAKPVDEKSDIFALGCMLYELLTTRLPFETVGDLYRGRYDPLPAEIANLIGSANALLKRMLSTNPNTRPAADEVVKVLATVRGAIAKQERLDRSAYTVAATRLLESVPVENATPVALADLAHECGIVDETMAMAVLQMPLTFGALQCTFEEATGELLVRAKSEVARFFLLSLALYVRYGLNFIERWERRADPTRGDALRLLGPDFVYAMERRRVFQYGMPQPIRTEHACQVVIKAFSSSRNAPVYLMHYDRFAQQFQMIGGKRRGGENAFEAMERAIRTKLPANDLMRDVDYELQCVRDDVVTRSLSNTVGAFTEYHFAIFSVAFKRPLVIEAEHRWVTEAELFSGKLVETMGTKWNYDFARVANLLEKGLANVPFSVPAPVE